MTFDVRRDGTGLQIIKNRTDIAFFVIPLQKLLYLKGDFQIYITIWIWTK